MHKAGNAKAALDAVPASARSDPGYIFARVQWLRQNNKAEEAGRLILTAPQDPRASVRSRSVVAGTAPAGAQAARRARCAEPPIGWRAKPRRRCAAVYRVDAHFTAGWIALRYLHDPKTAAEHFARIMRRHRQPACACARRLLAGPRGRSDGPARPGQDFLRNRRRSTPPPITASSRARGSASPTSACAVRRHSRRKSRTSSANLEVVRAAQILYALDERDMLASIFAELGESGTDIAGMAMLGELAAKHGDGRAMLLLGEAAYGARPAARLLRLSGRRPARLPADRAADRGRRSPIRSPARKATSIRRSSPAPMPWA